VKCEHAQPFVEAYADGELQGIRRHSVEKHLRTCARCAAAHAEILALRARVRAEVPYFAAPPGLQERVRAMVASTPSARAVAPTPRRGWMSGGGLADGAARVLPRWQWISSGALAGCAATVLAFVVGTAVLDWRTEQDLATQAVASHVRATLDHRLIEVASSDRHTVKPWLSERLDYSPPVRDLASGGFPLLGGRLTTLDGRAVATLVYGYRKHTIDVFVRPEGRNAPPLRELRGFNVAHVNGAGWDWLAVSDAGPEVLDEFLAQLVREASQP
jgi:anti-sigma factor RsiW